MPTVESSGTHTTAGAPEEDVYSTLAGKSFVWVLDLALLQAGDTYIVRVYRDVLDGGAERKIHEATYAGVQTELQVSIPVPAPYGARLTLERSGGADRAIPWSVELLGGVNVEQSGTLALTGAEDPVVTVTPNRAYVLIIDLNAAAGGDSMTLRIKREVLNGGTVRTLYSEIFVGAQDPDAAQSVPFSGPYGAAITAERTAGVLATIDWSLESVEDD